MTQIEKVQARIDYCTHQLELAEDRLEKFPCEVYEGAVNAWWDQREDLLDELEDLLAELDD